MDRIPNKLEGEIFKEIHESFNCEGYYISNFGRLYSFKSKRFLTQNPRKQCGYVYGYLIDKNSKAVCKAIHIFLMITFYGKAEDKVIDHIDRNKTNNHISNLRYATQSENNINRTLDKTKGRRIIMIDINGKETIFDSIMHAEKDSKFTRSMIVTRLKKGIYIDGILFKDYDEIIANEKWEEISIEEKIIKISNKGRIDIGERITYGTIRSGYYIICLQLKDRRKNFRIHRLVCEAFNGKAPTEKHVVNHKDKNPLNNCADNLEWISQKENTQYSFSKAVLQFDLQNNFIKEYASGKEATKEVKVNEKSVRNCCNGKYKTAGGFAWKFKEVDTKVYGSSHGNKPVFQFSLDGKFMNRYESVREAFEKTKSSHIPCVCAGRRKSSGGFYWEYDNNEEPEIVFED